MKGPVGPVRIMLHRTPAIARLPPGKGPFGLDLAKDMIPVRPGAHYMIGGVRVDLQGQPVAPDALARLVVEAPNIELMLPHP